MYAPWCRVIRVLAFGVPGEVVRELRDAERHCGGAGGWNVSCVFGLIMIADPAVLVSQGIVTVGERCVGVQVAHGLGARPEQADRGVGERVCEPLGLLALHGAVGDRPRAQRWPVAQVGEFGRRNRDPVGPDLFVVRRSAYSRSMSIVVRAARAT
jgi:hypothetical protein